MCSLTESLRAGITAPQGTLTHVQRFSLHDGPGIRTTVFLKGCNLRCSWCHNPETLRGTPELQFLPARCLGCRACLAACPQGAHRVTDGGRHELDRSRCTACGRCVKECFSGALMLVGRVCSVEQVLAEVLEDRAFYVRSGGGLTISGGEPFLQAEFCGALLQAAKAAGLHTAVETNLTWPWERLAGAMPFIDLVFGDLKAFDSEVHDRLTGMGNAQVLANIERLDAMGKPFAIRTPVQPHLHTVLEIASIAGFLGGFRHLLYYELVPAHPLGQAKYASLGYLEPAAVAVPSAVQMQRLAEVARTAGGGRLTVRIAGQGGVAV